MVGGIRLTFVHETHSVDIKKSQDPSMEDLEVLLELPMEEIETIDHGLQREVIVLYNRMLVVLYINS